MSIEDAARATKIRPRQIADLERDEYSNFANLAYARGFFVGYAKFLQVDVRAYLEAFEDANTFGLDDYQYLSEAPVGVYRVPTRRFRRPKRGGRLMAIGATLALLAVAATSWFLVVSYRRLGNLDELAARQAAREHAVRDGDAKGSALPPTGETIRVSAPAPGSPAPSPVPASDQSAAMAASLAAMEDATAIPVGALAAPLPAGSVPAVPLPGDGAAARALTRQGPDFRATLAGAPAASAQAKIRAADPARHPGDPYQVGAPQTVSNNSLR